MTLQEILEAVDELSVDEQTSLFNVLQVKLSQVSQSSSNGETFWAMTLRFRERMEREGIGFTDEDFANLRDRSPGREIDL
ncbi:hypothetical protein [Coleofasciculus sp.]|uniref:hypothetical protein n=1 Tax=Coleofasciculus sp. TaxID=3100458 RepID=UPI003A1DC0EA